MMKWLSLGMVASALVLAGCSDDEEGGPVAGVQEIDPNAPAGEENPEVAHRASMFGDKGKKPNLAAATGEGEPKGEAEPSYTGLREGELPGAFAGEQFGNDKIDRDLPPEEAPPPGDVDRSGFFTDKLAVPYHEADRGETFKNARFGERGALAERKRQLAPRVLEGRLTALGKRVRQMQDEWVAARGDPNPKALSRQARKIADSLAPLMRKIEKRAAVSVHVRDLKTQRTLYDYKGSELRNPASNQKMLTASAALDLLGPEYRFKTEAYSRGDTLYLVGGGDPKIDITRITVMAKELAEKANLAEVKRFVIDQSNFSEPRFIPGIALDDVGFYYMAPTGPLSMNGNIIRITVRPSRPGQPVHVTVEPQSGHVVVDNSAVTVSDDEAPGVFVRTGADRDKTIVKITGKMTIHQGAETHKRRISDPGLFAGEAFAQALADASGGLRFPVTLGEKPSNAILMKRWESEPLFEIVQEAMAHSNNFITEMVLRTLAREMTGEPGDYDIGATMLEAYWNTIGVNPEALVAENGSGLSRAGRFTAAGLVDLVSATHMTQFANSGLLAVLPVAGRPGTLHRRHLQARGRLKAKTGTLDGVSALSGVLTDTQGEPVLALSIMLNPSSETALSVGERHAAEEQVVGVLLKYLQNLKKRGW